MFKFEVYCSLVFLEYDYGNVNKKTGSVLVDNVVPDAIPQLSLQFRKSNSKRLFVNSSGMTTTLS